MPNRDFIDGSSRRPFGSPIVVGPIIALLLLLFPPPVFGQLLREAQTPYHLLRYDDVPSDQQSPAWSKDLWAPIKFIPLRILSGRYLFTGSDSMINGSDVITQGWGRSSWPGAYRGPGVGVPRAALTTEAVAPTTAVRGHEPAGGSRDGDDHQHHR